MKLAMALAAVFLAAAGCGGGGVHPETVAEAVSGNETGTEAVNGTETGSEAGAEVTTIFTHPADGRLYAAAGSAIISPTGENHPCTIYLGGTGRNRVAKGVHDDLQATALVLEHDGQPFVLVELDLVGLDASDVALFAAALAPYGVDPAHLVVASTHTHAGPDTMGIWGPDATTSGRCPAYIGWLVDTVTALVKGLAPAMVPVSLAVTEAQVDEPGSDFPALVRDFSDPFVIHNRLGVASFKDEAGAAVATLVNWHAHPETMIGSDRVAADFPRYLRRAVEKAVGGTCLYLSGTLGGLQVPLDLKVPQYTPEGQPVLVEGEKVYVAANDEVKEWSLGYALAGYVLAALEGATPVPAPGISVETVTVTLPVTNPNIYIMNKLALVNPMDLETTSAPECHKYGCLHQAVSMLSLGTLHLLALPGEVLPESSLGRPDLTVTYDQPWEPVTYPAMSGWREALPAGHYLLEIGLANNEIGYIVPRADWLPPSHPNAYCQSVALGIDVETRLHAAVLDLLGGITP
jgi:hypothetical protein